MKDYKYQLNYNYSKICQTCKNLFYKKKCRSFKTWSNQKFCCYNCRRPNDNINLKNRKFTKLDNSLEILCKNCEKSFYVKTMYDYKRRKFCSVSCSVKDTQKDRNYWDKDEQRKENLQKKQKEKIENNKWLNPIFADGALEKMKETKQQNPVVFSEERLELASKLAAIRLVNDENPNLGCYRYGKIGYFLSEKNNKKLKYRSSFEKKAFSILELDTSVSSFVVEPFRIKYILNNKKRYYVPDLLVTYNDGLKKLVEVKPVDKLLEADTIVKKEYAEEYCEVNNIFGGYEIWTETVLFPNRKL